VVVVMLRPVLGLGMFIVFLLIGSFAGRRVKDASAVHG
jgi:hypothetical protein